MIETGEFRVFWKDESGKDVESKAYYTDDPEDAVDTLYDISSKLKDTGVEYLISDDKVTGNLLEKY